MESLDTIFASLGNVYDTIVLPLIRMSAMWGNFVGLLIFFIGTWKLFTFYGDKNHKREKSPAGYVWMLVVGVLMMYSSQDSGLTYLVSEALGVQNSEAKKGSLAFVFGVVEVVGLIGVYMGLMQLYKKGANQSTLSTGNAITKIVAGAIAINMEKFVDKVGSSFGGQVESTFNLINNARF